MRNKAEYGAGHWVENETGQEIGLGMRLGIRLRAVMWLDIGLEMMDMLMDKGEGMGRGGGEWW